MTVCQPSPRSKPQSLCGLTQVGLQLQKREVARPKLCSTPNESSGYVSGEEALPDTNSTGHGFTAIPVMLQPSQTPGAATPPGGGCGETPVLAQPGDSHPANTGEAELIRGTITWSSTTMKLPTLRELQVLVGHVLEIVAPGL